MFIKKEGFCFPNLELHHSAFPLANLKFWIAPPGGNSPWVPLEYSYIILLVNRDALGCKYNRYKIVSLIITSIWRFWYIIYRKWTLDAFTHPRLRLNNWDLEINFFKNLPIMQKIWIGANILCYRLIRWNDELNYVLKDKYYLPNMIQWQYLQLQHLFMSLFAPAAFLALEIPILLQTSKK